MAKNRHTPPEGDYTIGYGRPPKTFQWKKGVSGNPTGRKKGSLNSKTVLADFFSLPVTLTVNGEPVEMTVANAIYLNLYSNMTKGNMAAAIYLSKTYINMFGGEDGPAEELTEDDEAILDRHLGRRSRGVPLELTDRRSEPGDVEPDGSDEPEGSDKLDDDGGELIPGQDGGGDGRP